MRIGQKKYYLVKAICICVAFASAVWSASPIRTMFEKSNSVVSPAATPQRVSIFAMSKMNQCEIVKLLNETLYEEHCTCLFCACSKKNKD